MELFSWNLRGFVQKTHEIISFFCSPPHRCMLGTFFTMLLLIFCAQIAAGVLGFLFKSHIEAQVQQKAKEIVFMKYGTGDRKIDYAVDLLQEKLQCCGADKWEDYQVKTFLSSSLELVALFPALGHFLIWTLQIMYRMALFPRVVHPLYTPFHSNTKSAFIRAFLLWPALIGLLIFGAIHYACVK